jgi:ATP-dependent Clp protease ATP-binding subunit ClpA
VFERFDDDARRAVVEAQEFARRSQHLRIGTAHILGGLLAQDWFASAQVLVRLGTSEPSVMEAIGAVQPPAEGTPGAHIPFSPAGRRAITLSPKEAKQLGAQQVGTEHLLLGVLREGKGAGASALQSIGIDYRLAREAVLAWRSEG